MKQQKAILSLSVAIAMQLTTSSSFAAVSPMDLVPPIAQYKLYVLKNSNQLLKDTEQLVAAVRSGNTEKAKALYPTTRISYERIEPIAELFSDLDSAIDSRADDHEQAEKSSDFGGFHRIEYALWVESDTTKLNVVADNLLRDVRDLNKRLATLTFPPEKVVGGAAVLMEEVAATKISGEENRYSHTDLYDFQANFDGAFKIFSLMKPLLGEADQKFVKKTDANFQNVFDTLKKYQTKGGGFESYEKLTERDRKMLASRVNTLAEDLSKLRGMLGLD